VIAARDISLNKWNVTPDEKLLGSDAIGATGFDENFGSHDGTI